jgi:hypothetical protein
VKTSPQRSKAMKITATCKFNDNDLTDIPVLNPDGWFGKTWLIELGGSYTPLFLIVEADTMSDAIDELSDNGNYGHQIHVPDSDLGDYPENDRHYDGSGRVIDLDHLMVHGQEQSEAPFPVKYYGDELPPEGIDPRQLSDWEPDGHHRIRGEDHLCPYTEPRKCRNWTDAEAGRGTGSDGRNVDQPRGVISTAYAMTSTPTSRMCEPQLEGAGRYEQGDRDEPDRSQSDPR